MDDKLCTYENSKNYITQKSGCIQYIMYVETRKQYNLFNWLFRFNFK